MAASHQAQVSDSEYHNWVRCVLGLKYTQEGLYPFIDNEAKKFHKTLTTNVSAQLNVQSVNCNQCTIKTILPKHTSGTCPARKRNNTGQRKIKCICTSNTFTRRSCPADVCGRLHDEIVSAHRYGEPAWWNSDMTLWTGNHWEVIKNFLPSTGGYKHISSAADTDCSGLLNIAINVMDITSGIASAPGVFGKCRITRNTILHSSSQKLSDTDRDNYIQTMIDVLECTPALKADQAAQQAVTKLQQVKSDLYMVTAADMTAAKQEVQHMVAEGLERIDDRTTEGLEQIEDKTTRSIKQMVDKTTESIAQVVDKTTKNLAQVDDKTSESLAAIAKTADSKMQQIQEAGDKVYEKDKAEFKHRLLQLVKERFVSTPVADSIQDMVSVETLFVKPTFEILGTKNILGNKTAPRKVASTMELFFKDDQLCKRIYLAGDAGTGKTTFCKQIAHAWWHFHSETDQCASDIVCTQYLDIMKNFDFIFYLPLRSFRHMFKVEEMLESHYFPSQSDFMRKVLSRESCLVILDGLDEWGPPESYQQPVSGTYGLPEYGDIYPFTALVTTRPWKLEVLRLKSTEIDLQVRLSGIDRRQAEKLGQKMIDYLNKETHNEKHLYDFTTMLYTSKVNQLMKIPILLKQLVMLWYRRNTFGNSMCQLYSEMIDLMLEQSQIRNKGMPLSEPQGCMEESKNVELPQCFESTEYCPDHVGILYSMAKVAFKTLFNKDQTCSLVFPHNAKVHGFSKPDIELMLKTGIMSQHIDFSCYVKKHKSLSFLHKSLQEFLAAVYICISDSHACLKQVFQLCKTRELVLQMKDVFVFISGLNGDLAEKIPKFIQSVLSSDISANSEIDKDDSSEIMQKFVIDCLQESSVLDKLPVWQTESIFINNIRSLKTTYLRHLIQNNAIKCVTIHNFRTILQSNDNMSLQELHDCLTDLTLCTSVHSVVLYLIFELTPELVDRIFKALLYGRTLKKLTLRSWTPEPWEPFIQYLKCHSLASVTSLFIALDCPSPFSHSDMQIIIQQVSLAASLYTLTLIGIECKDHRWKCPCILDLTRQTKLQELDVRCMHIGGVKIETSKLISCTLSELPRGTSASLLHVLHGASSLLELDLSELYDGNDVDHIVSLLQSLPNLSHLKLGNITFKDRLVCLSPQASRIKSIKLDKICISDVSLLNFVEKLPATQHEIHFSVLGNHADLDEHVKKSNKRFVVTSSYPGVLIFHTIPIIKAEETD